MLVLLPLVCRGFSSVLCCIRDGEFYDWKNSTAAAVAPKPKEVALPVYVDDLPSNVREGFDKTCVYIKDCTDVLEERLNSKFEAIRIRFDALTHNLVNPPARAEPPPAATLQAVAELAIWQALASATPKFLYFA